MMTMVYCLRTHMSKIKVSEIFYSIQGEGRYMGVPSVFLRTFGCNLTCSGFGMPLGEKSIERDLIVATQYNNYNDLPLVSTGCDSYGSWDPRFKHLSLVMEIDEIVNTIIDLLPKKDWDQEHLVITGGEPLLGWQRAFPELLSHPKMKHLQEVTFETNGTQHITDEFAKYIKSSYINFTFSVSPKLSCSGHTLKETIHPDVVTQYESLGYTYLKFVVATDSDVHEALEVISHFRYGWTTPFAGHVYLMPVGGVESVYNLNNRRVAELALKYGLRYSDRLQVPLFKNAWGT